MTYQEAKEIIQNCKLNWLDCKIDVVCPTKNNDMIYVIIKIPTVDVYDPPVSDLKNTGIDCFYNYKNITQEKLVAFIFNDINKLIQHEIAEQFYYNGDRIFDPHKKDLVPIS